MRKRFIALLVGALVGALLIVGCGSSSDETTASITKAEFLKQGNAICKAGNEEINEGFENFGKEHNLKPNKEPSEAQFEELSETVLVPSVSTQIKEVRALGAPEGEEGEVDEFLTHAEEALEELEGEPALIAAEGKEEPFYLVNKEAATLGLTACGGEEEQEKS